MVKTAFKFLLNVSDSHSYSVFHLTTTIAIDSRVKGVKDFADTQKHLLWRKEVHSFEEKRSDLLYFYFLTFTKKLICARLLRPSLRGVT